MFFSYLYFKKHVAYINWLSNRNSISTFDLDSIFGIKIRFRLDESKSVKKSRLDSWQLRTRVEILTQVSNFSTLISKLSRIISYQIFRILIFRLVYYIFNLYCIHIIFLHYLFVLYLYILSLHYFFVLSLCIISLHYLFVVFLYIAFIVNQDL